MPFIGLSILIQLLCAVHCVRNRGNSLWLMVIIFLSIPGCLAYFVFEIFPQLTGRREVRAVKAAAVRRLDPERDLRAAREALEMTDTAANRTALGDALADSGAWAEAALHHREALAKMPRGDRIGQFKLARALLESGNAAEARRMFEALPESAAAGENDRVALLLARSLEALGETEQALALYDDIARRLPGGEAQCRQAALLIARGREREAMAVLAEVEKKAKRIDRYERKRQADMYDWAARTLAELRAAQAGS
jgi:hypothetical protein